jgi:hypothetical protein
MGKNKEIDERSDLIQLYGIEAGLVQEKLNHILAIRSLAFTIMAAIIGASIIFSSNNLFVLILIMIPFYVLESSYDGYLICIIERETTLRYEIAKSFDAVGLGDLANKYRTNYNHRCTPKGWSPFKRALVEPLRVGFYSAIVLIIAAVQFGGSILSFISSLLGG